MEPRQDKQVIIVGGGFAGLNAAKQLGSKAGVQVLLIDRSNHHLFQPLLYQVAMAGLSPADIAAPIRGLLSRHKNISVLQGRVTSVDLAHQLVVGDFGQRGYDYLLVATGARHAYFGHDEWEPHAPGLKTLAQATDIRRRVLRAFERAEVEPDAKQRRALLTFVVVGGGPTGVELAGAIGEMSRSTLARDFRRIDPKSARVILVEAGPHILPAFPLDLSDRAARDLESLGVQVWTDSAVTHVAHDHVTISDERLHTHTVLWAAGVMASTLGRALGSPVDRQGRVEVQADLSLVDHPQVFVAGDLAHAIDRKGAALPAVAPVAMQAGQFVGRTILSDLAGAQRAAFRYRDKGQMATIGRSRAVFLSGPVRLKGLLAWLAWLLIHIYYLSTFRNRLIVLLQWAWSYVTFGRGARLIVDGPAAVEPPDSDREDQQSVA